MKNAKSIRRRREEMRAAIEGLKAFRATHSLGDLSVRDLREAGRK